MSLQRKVLLSLAILGAFFFQVFPIFSQIFLRDSMVKAYIWLASMAGLFLAGYFLSVSMSPKKERTLREGWNKALAFTVFLFVCHGGALLFFLPRIGARLGIGPVLMIGLPSLACWIALPALLAAYRKRVFPVNEAIERLIGDRPPLFPPQATVTVYRKLMVIEDSIRSVQERSGRAGKYLRLLAKNKGENGAGSLIEKHKEYAEYFNAHYAEYCSLDISVRFQFYISLIQEVIIPEGIIRKLDIERFVEALKADLESRKEFLRDNKKAGPVVAGLDESMKVVEKEMARVTSYLIALQSSETIAGTSPLDEKNLLDIYRQGGDIETAFSNLRKLDDEHDRFMAERELLEP